MVPTFSGTRYDLALFQTVSPSESFPRSIVRHGDVTIKNMFSELCLCVGSVAKWIKASDYESEESRFESWQSLFFQRIKKVSTLECHNHVSHPIQQLGGRSLGQRQDRVCVGIVERTPSAFSTRP